jgi:integrase
MYLKSGTLSKLKKRLPDILEGVFTFCVWIKTGFKSRPGYLLRKLIINLLHFVFNPKAVSVPNSVPSSFIILFSLVASDEVKALPHIPAVLLKPRAGSKVQRWRIKYSVWDVSKNCLTEKYYTQLNSIKDLKQRAIHAKEKIKEINLVLAKGYYWDPAAKARKKKEAEKAQTQHIISVAEVLKIALNNKRIHGERHYNGLKTHATKFIEWLTIKNLHTLPAKDLSYKILKDFLKYLTLEKELSNRTRNNYLEDISTLLNEAAKEIPTVVNPAKAIENLSEGTGKNIAYVPEQQKELLKYTGAELEITSESTGKPDKRYISKLPYFFISQFMYYTLARTSEISKMQVKHIGMYNPDMIYLAKENSKSRIERHITIHPALEKLLERFNIRKLDPEWFIFSKGALPGPDWEPGKIHGEKYRANVLDKLGYHKDYTLYSWKHTGVVSAWRAGVSKSALFVQLGYKSTDSFEIYLKSLGLFDNEELKTKFPALPE